MMHIAYVCTDPGIPVWGAKGASIHVQEMLRAFVQRGDRVTLLTPRLGGDPPTDLAGVTVDLLPPAPKGNPETRARGLLAMNDAVAKALERLLPDVVYERHALFAHAAMEWAAKAARPGVLEVNAPLLAEQASHRELALPLEAEASVKRAMHAASLVCGVTDPVVHYAQSMGARDAIVVPNAVNPARFPEPLARPDRPFTVGFLGSMKPWHGLSTLVEAFAGLRLHVADARLLIVGDGPERPAIEAQLATLALSDSAEITGLLPASEVAEALAGIDVGTAPYHAMEDFYFSPLKIYEYMAAGLPIVTSRAGHLDQLVSDEETGLVVAPGDAQALAKALMQMANDRQMARAMGDRARAHVLAHHTWSATADRVLSRALGAEQNAA
jgi:glycosyltransferase involved in cell wall biosynthesis